MPGLALNPHCPRNGPLRGGRLPTAQMWRRMLTVVSQGMTKAPEGGPQAQPVTLDSYTTPGVLGTGGLALPVDGQR